MLVPNFEKENLLKVSNIVLLVCQYTNDNHCFNYFQPTCEVLLTTSSGARTNFLYRLVLKSLHAPPTEGVETFGNFELSESLTAF